MSIWFILAAMIFLHIIDDYVLQSRCLVYLKQKDWWKKEASDSIYAYDYVWALIMHGFSWAFMVMLPLAFYRNFDISSSFFCVLVTNALLHALIDDAKANLKLINLWADQVCHLEQIVGTLLLFSWGVI